MHVQCHICHIFTSVYCIYYILYIVILLYLHRKNVNGLLYVWLCLAVQIFINNRHYIILFDGKLMIQYSLFNYNIFISK